MATLQKIRSKGPLLVIAIGLGLLGFIAGDGLLQIFRPHQSQDVGEVNGESISVQEYKALVDEYTDVLKYSRGVASLTEEQTAQLQDEVWRIYVENKLVEAEAEKLGFKRMLIPQNNLKGFDTSRLKIELIPVRKVEEAFRQLFG